MQHRETSHEISRLGQFAFKNCAWFTGIWHESGACNSKWTRGNFQNTVQWYQIIRTQRGWFSLVFIMKTNISPEEKFTANVRISVLYLYLCDVSPQVHFDSKLLRLVVDFVLPTGAIGSFTRANFRRCARLPVISRLVRKLNFNFIHMCDLTKPVTWCKIDILSYWCM